MNQPNRRTFKSIAELKEVLGELPPEVYECSTLYGGCGKVWTDNPPTTCPCRQGRIMKARIASFEDHHEHARSHVESWRKS